MLGVVGMWLNKEAFKGKFWMLALPEIVKACSPNKYFIRFKPQKSVCISWYENVLKLIVK